MNGVDRADTIERVLVWVIRGALFLVPFIPLVVVQSLFFPYITGKAVVFRTAVELAFAAWLFLAVRNPAFRPRKTPLAIALAAFIAAVTLASVMGANPYRSFWSNYERMEGLVTYLHLFAYFLVLANVFRKRDWTVFWNLFVVAGFGQNAFALFQKLGYFASRQGGFRVDGTIGNPTYVAAYLIFVLLISVLLFMGARNRWLRGWYAFMGFFSLLTIYFTATRGVAVALAGGFLIAGVWFLLRYKAGTPRAKKIKLAVAGVLVLFLLAGIGIKVFRTSDFVKRSEILSRFASISLKEGTSRFLIWNMGFRGFKERPILGWGPENYNIIFAKYYNPKLFTQEPWFDRSHNIVFDWLINAGIVGLLAYLGLFVSAVYMLWQRDRHAPVAVLLSLFFLVYFIQNLFVFDQLATYLSFFALLAFISNGAWKAAQPEPPRPPAPARKEAWWPLAFGGVLAAGLGLAWYTVNFRPIAANGELINALIASRANPPAAFAAYERALGHGSHGSQEVREQMSQFAIYVIGLQDAVPAFKEKVFTRAVAELREGARENPRDPRAHLFLAAVLREGGQLDQAISAFEQAVMLSPAKQQIYFELGDTYIRKGDYKIAAQILAHAYELEPKFDEARMNAVAGYILNGEQEKADAILVAAFGTVDVPDRVLAQVYVLRKDFARLLGVWQAFVGREPENVDYRKNVAAVYIELKKPREAIRALEEAIEAIPSFKEEGEELIRGLRSELL